MTRPTSWYPLTWGDPVPGDPVAVRAAADDHQRVADQIAEAAEALRGIVEQAGQSASVLDALDDAATGVADGIEQAYGRYVAAALALDTYAGTLSEAQATSLEALASATTAEQARCTAQQKVLTERALERGTLDPVEISRHGWLADTAGAEVSTAEAQIEDARVLLAGAVAARDAAAEEARALIDAVVQVDGLSDTLWQDVSTGAVAAATAVWSHLDDIALGLAVLSVAFSWVPGINAALATSATVVGVIVLVRDVCRLAQGDGSWLDVGLGVLSLVTFGLGRVAARGLRITADAARLSSGMRAAGASTRSVRSASVGAVDDLAGGAATVLRGLPSRVRPLLNRSTLATLRPSAVVRDTAADLKGGWQALRLPVTRAPGSAGAHAAGPAARWPVTEPLNPIKSTWQTNRVAGVFHVLGAEGVARDVAFLAQQGAPRTAWTVVNAVPQVDTLGQTTYGVVEKVRA